MCGEIDEQAVIGGELQDRMRALLRDLGKQGKADAAPADLEDEAGRAAYMDAIYETGLARALAGISAAEEGQSVDALACQAIALARLAGYLAGQLPPEADLFRTAVSSLVAGHADGGQKAADLGRSHDHHHHHHHHDHGHDHDHHH